MQKYVCGVCGYEYDPAENDNVPFEDLPDNVRQVFSQGVLVCDKDAR